jgi:hypothetical protein
MNTSRISTGYVGLGLLMVAAASSAGSALDQLEVYRGQGVEQADAAHGRQLWYTPVAERSCSNCHGENPVAIGSHVKTGKEIAPMAPSVNPERYQSAKKIEKWFRRNCKWTFGRECSAQEKADILTWLASQ